MDKKAKNLNPFAQASTNEERERVWKSLKAVARPVSKKEGERLMKEAIRLQLENNK
ncbi:hypothetical protein [Cyclobacterium xiamenense]|jgi:isocitrate dehydrogenase|uniref:hypothetical protein n=1 Tax=Cyclobacterium xiamenense TaxID=1297121 RepID=UPI0012B747B8|nr:hypothetical protein [Cyclobacterium xiamenense]